MTQYRLYPTDMSDAAWDILKEIVPPAESGGRPRELDMRLVINATNYMRGVHN